MLVSTQVTSLSCAHFVIRMLQIQQVLKGTAECIEMVGSMSVNSAGGALFTDFALPNTLRWRTTILDLLCVRSATKDTSQN